MRAVPVLAVAVALVVLAGGGAAAQTPIRLGASVSLSGAHGHLGRSQREGYQLCAEHLNNAGGLLGRPVGVVVYDDESSPAAGVLAYERLLAEDGIVAVLAPASLALATAVANVTERARTVMLSPLAAGRALVRPGRRYTFAVAAPAERALDGLVDLAWAQGLQTMAVLAEGTAAPAAMAAGVSQAARRRGLHVVRHEVLAEDAEDLTVPLVRLRALAPDVILVVGAPDVVAAALRQMHELRVSSRLVGVAGVDGELELPRLLGRLAEDVYEAVPWHPTLRHPGQHEFVESYKNRFGRPPGAHAAGGYAGCMLYATAAGRAGSVEADKVRAELLRLETTTAFGPYRVAADGTQTAHRTVVLQWQHGRPVVVWPDELATGSARPPGPARGRP